MGSPDYSAFAARREAERASIILRRSSPRRRRVTRRLRARAKTTWHFVAAPGVTLISICRETDLPHVLCGWREPRRGARSIAGGFSPRMERLEGRALEGGRTALFGSVRRPSGAHFSILRFTPGCRPGLLSARPFGALPAGARVSRQKLIMFDACHWKRNILRLNKPRGRNPSGHGGERASAVLPLLDDVTNRLRRGALHLPTRRSRQNANLFLREPLVHRFAIMVMYLWIAD